MSSPIIPRMGGKRRLVLPPPPTCVCRGPQRYQRRSRVPVLRRTEPFAKVALLIGLRQNLLISQRASTQHDDSLRHYIEKAP